MSKSKSTPMTRTAANRIASVAAKNSGGHIPAKSFASRADAGVQRATAAGQQTAQANKR